MALEMKICLNSWCWGENPLQDIMLSFLEKHCDEGSV